MRVLLESRSTYQRLVVLATSVFLVTGCGDKGLDKPLPAVPESLQVILPWADGDQIPRKYTCDGSEQKPRVRVQGRTPHGVAIVMTDPDAPGGTFVHWTHWGAVDGKNSFGKVGYSGPCPPEGDQAHRYVVTAYALKSKLRLARGAGPEEVVDAIRRQAVESGSTTGRYGR
jgi:phosphatidylethanolamine-binding protein (PEBP) family uncharacterized protein